MKFIKGALACAALVLGACAPEPKQESAFVDSTSPDLPAFKFRGMEVGKTTVADAEKAGTVTGCKPVLSAKSTIHCKFVKNELDGNLMSDMHSFVPFKEGKFDGFVMTFERGYVGDAVRSAYGKRCDYRDDLLPPNASVWCFNEGLMVLEMPGLILENSMSLRFSPYREEKKFTPDTI